MNVHYQRIRSKSDREIGRIFKKVNPFWEYLKLIKNNPHKLEFLKIDCDNKKIKIRVVSTHDE